MNSYFPLTMQKDYNLFPVNNGQEKITSAEWTQYIDHHS